MPATTKLTRTYPWTDVVAGREVVFRLMTPADRKVVLDFTKQLAEADVVFLRMDITQPSVVDEWLENIKRGQTITVLAESDHHVIGYGSLHHNDMLWTRHLGEIRILAATEFRETDQLEQQLALEVFQIAKELGLKRIIAQIPHDQPRMHAMYDGMGFKAEALLTDWLMTADGRTHDLLVLSHRVED